MRQTAKFAYFQWRRSKCPLFLFSPYFCRKTPVRIGLRAGLERLQKYGYPRQPFLEEGPDFQLSQILLGEAKPAGTLRPPRASLAATTDLYQALQVGRAKARKFSWRPGERPGAFIPPLTLAPSTGTPSAHPPTPAAPRLIDPGAASCRARCGLRSRYRRCCRASRSDWLRH
jgi:hypothetical protein